MKASFDINRTGRNVISKFLEDYSLEQLNVVPAGFSNNLIWNIGHIVVVQQMLVYNLSGLPMMVSDEMVSRYKRGTRPGDPVRHQEIDLLKNLLFSTIEKTETDFNSGVFINYHSFTTMSGYTINNVTDAITFNNYHEGVHTGVMLGIRKFL